MTPAPYPTPPPVEVDPVAEADLGAHAALITGVHGVPAFTTGVDDGKGLIWGNGGWQKTATPLVTDADLDQLTPSRLGVNSTIAANTQARIVAQGSAYTPLVLRGAAAQTANLQEWQDSAGVILARIGSTGRVGTFALTTPSGSTERLQLAPAGNSSVQVNTAGTTETGLVVRGIAAQTGNLQEWQDSTGVILARVDSTGQINANNAGFNILRSKDSTTNRISLSSGVVATEVQNNLATNAIGLAVRGIAGQTGDLQQWRDSTSAVVLSVDNNGVLFRPAGMLFTANTAATTGLRVKGTTAQTANLQEWQDSTGVAIAKVDSAGNLNAARLLTGGRAAFGNAAADATAQAFVAGNVATDTVLRVKGAASQTGNLQEWQDGAGGLLARVTSGGMGIFGANVVGGQTGGPPAGYTHYLNNAATASVVLTAKAAAGQTADVFQALDSAGGKLAAIDAAGRHYIANSVAPATPTLGGLLYVASGALRFKGSAGTDTLIANA